MDKAMIDLIKMRLINYRQKLDNLEVSKEALEIGLQNVERNLIQTKAIILELESLESYLEQPTPQETSSSHQPTVSEPNTEQSNHKTSSSPDSDQPHQASQPTSQQEQPEHKLNSEPQE